MNRQIYRQQPRHFDGYRRTNFCTDIRTYGPNNIVYKITPVGIGKLTTFRQKIQIIIDQNKLIFQQTVNPLFEFAVTMFALYRAITFGFNLSKITSKMIEELTFDLKPKKNFEKIQDCIQDHAKKVCSKQVQAQFQGKTRIQKLKVYEARLDKEAEETIEKTKLFYKNLLETKFPINLVIENTVAISAQTKQLLISDQYILQQINAIRSIQPLTYAQQYEKFKIFQKKYQTQYKAVLQIDRNKQYYFHVAKISSEAEPVLQRLSQFVDLRFEEADYSAESASFIKDIYNQLKVYEQNMINNDYKRRDPYICLSPHNVILDQLALKPLLHFEPLLLQALGLRSRPRSLQGRLAFEPTPKGIDYFKTDVQYSQSFERMRRDPLYGCSDLYIAEKQNVNHQQIDQERQQIQETKDSIITWRFLLLSYFIRNSKEFGRLNDARSEKEALEQFLENIKCKKKALRQDASQLEQFVGATKNTASGATFEGTFEELGQFLSGQKDDSVIQKHGYDRTVRYTALRWMLIREASAMLQLKDTNLFSKLINAKKYTILLLLAGEQIFEEASRLIRWERERTGERKRVRQLIQSSVRRTKKEKPYDYFKTIFNKIEEYLSRKNTDSGYRYLVDSDSFIYKLLLKANNHMVTLRDYTEKLDQLQNRQDPRQRQFYKQKLIQTQAFIEANYPSLTILLKEIIYIEIDQAREIIHKMAPKDQTQTNKFLELSTRKFLMTTFALFSLDESKFPLYESLVIPLLHLGQLAGSQEQFAVFKSLTKEELERHREDLQTVERIIEYQKIRPKQLSFIRPSQNFRH